MAKFEPSVERWRSTVRTYSRGLPVDFLLAWMKKESSGRPGVVSKLGERGMYQIHPQGERQLLALNDTDWDRLLSDATFDISQGTKLAALYRARATKLLAKNGAVWGGKSLYKMTKLQHGAPLVASEILKAFVTTYHRAPSNWTEFETFGRWAVDTGSPLLSSKVKILAPRVLANASEVGEYANSGTPLALAAVAAGIASGHPFAGIAAGLLFMRSA